MSCRTVQSIQWSLAASTLCWAPRLASQHFELWVAALPLVRFLHPYPQKCTLGQSDYPYWSDFHSFISVGGNWLLLSQCPWSYYQLQVRESDYFLLPPRNIISTSSVLITYVQKARAPDVLFSFTCRELFLSFAHLDSCSPTKRWPDSCVSVICLRRLCDEF